MKLKVKFDKDAILAFCLDHVEKFIFAGVILCFVMMIVAALGLPGFPRTPDQLRSAAQNAKEHIARTEPVCPPGVTSPDYPQIVETALRPVKVDRYKSEKPLNPLVFDPPTPRQDPPRYNVEKLRGIAGRDAFRVKEVFQPGAGAHPAARGKQQDMVRGQRWVALTALVPIKRQRQAYEETFDGCEQYDPAADVPKYAYYLVERAEATDSAVTDNLQWTLLDPRQQYRLPANWAGQPNEIVPEKYLDPQRRLVFPLGPRVGPQGASDGRPRRPGAAEGPPAWEESMVAYPPEISLAPRAEEPAAPAAVPPPDDPGGIPGLELPGIVDPLGAGPRGDAPMVPAAGPHPTPGPRGRAAMAGADSEAEAAPEYWLLRFFDFNVKPGKQYRYRVKLVLVNPNYGVDPRYLAKPALGKDKYKRTIEWTDPTSVISVPRDANVLAVSVKPPIRVSADPSARVAIVKWVEEHGKVAYTEDPLLVGRGQVLNFRGRKFPEVKEPRKGRKKPKDNELRPAAVEPAGPKAIDVDYVTDAVVLDIRGGERLPGPRRLAAPGYVLLLDPDGSLVVQSELEDALEFERQRLGPQSDDGSPGPTSPGRGGGGLDDFAG